MLLWRSLISSRWSDRQSHLLARAYRYIASGDRTITARAIISAGRPVHMGLGPAGWKKFIPKNPTRNDSGMNNVVMMVRVFITSFIRLLMTDR